MSDDHNFEDFPEDNALTRSSLGHAPSARPLQPNKSIHKDKLQTFQSGFRKKTAFERQKEELEEKKRREEEEAAKVYADFVASFEEPDPGEKIFLRGGTLVPSGTKLEEINDADSKDRIFRACLPGSSERKSLSQDLGNEDRLTYQPEEPKTSNPLKRRKMDEFMSKLKRKHEEAPEEPSKRILAPPPREPMLPYSAISTNVYVGNLHPKVDEDFLCREFAKFGPIASVKVMWPRSAEELARGRNSGFVCFMDRASAQRAMHGMQGREFFGQTVRLDWGKPVALPAKPYFVLDKFLPKPSPTATTAAASTSISTIGSQATKTSAVNAETRELALVDSGENNGKDGGSELVEPQAARAEGLGPSSAGTEAAAPSAPPVPVRQPDEEIHVVVPDNQEALRLIHRTIEFVLDYGHGFEEVLMLKHKDNPSFLFLHNLSHPYHQYYRWKLYSLLQGDEVDDWRVRPFRMVSQGPYWIPPPCPKRTERELMEESQHQQQASLESQGMDEDGTLPSSDLDLENEHYTRQASKRVLRRLRTLCKHLGTDRYSVARAMAFCVDASEAAADLAAELAHVLQHTETASHQLAMLHLVHDVLHNCTAPVANAWRYRDALQQHLPDMLRAMATTYMQLRTESRWKAEGWRTDVLAVVALWRQSMLYPRDFLLHLEVLFRVPDEPAAEGTPQPEAAPTPPTISTTVVSHAPEPDTAPSPAAAIIEPAPVRPPVIHVSHAVTVQAEATKSKPMASAAMAFGIKSVRMAVPKSSMFDEEAEDENDVEDVM